MGRDAGLGGRGGLRAALGYHNPPVAALGRSTGVVGDGGGDGRDWGGVLKGFTGGRAHYWGALGQGCANESALKGCTGERVH